MARMHLTTIYAAFYICEVVILMNIVKIKRRRINDGLQYHLPMTQPTTYKCLLCHAEQLKGSMDRFLGVVDKVDGVFNFLGLRADLWVVGSNPLLD